MKIVSLVDPEANLGGANQQNVVEFSTIASNTKTDLIMKIIILDILKGNIT